MAKDGDYGTLAKRIFQPLRNLCPWPRLRGPVETTQTRYDLVSEATGTAGRLRSGDARPVRLHLRRRESQPRDVEKRLWHESPGGGGRSTVLSRHPLSVVFANRS